MFKEKIKSLIQKEKGEEKSENNKKKIENLVVLVIILIITVIVINLIWNGDNGDNGEEKKPTSDPNKKLATTIEEGITEETVQASSSSLYKIDAELEEILSKIEGVGEVNVMITYSQTSQTIPLYNEDRTTKDTEETDKSGGTRKITESDSKKDIIFKESDGEKQPITQSIISPKIEGAIIAAKGAANVDVKTKIVQAVEAVTGLATHKIQVFEMQS